jgi:hypothetical protein
VPRASASISWSTRPKEFERMREEERPFLVHALEGAKVVYEG